MLELMKGTWAVLTVLKYKSLLHNFHVLFLLV
jgi:hypothetical protein